MKSLRTWAMASREQAESFFFTASASVRVRNVTIRYACSKSSAKDFGSSATLPPRKSKSVDEPRGFHVHTELSPSFKES